MAQWTKILSDFDAEEETINFGTRNFAETSKSVYETWTLATIQSETTVVSNPKISASIIQSYPGIIIDNNITIFDSQSCQTVLLNIGFNFAITSYCLSSNAQYIFISVQPATLYCFDLHNNNQQLFTINFQKDYCCSCIIKICLEELKDIFNAIIVTSDGKILKISNLNLFFIDKNQESSVFFSKNIAVLSKISAINHAYYVNDEYNDESSIVALGNNCIYLYQDGFSSDPINLPYQLTKVQFFNGSNKGMICLSTDGKLSIVCLNTLLMRKVWDGPVTDFVTLNEKSDNFYMLVLMKPDDVLSPHTSLHLMSFPDFQIIFTMSVTTTTYLFEIIGDDPMDHLIIIEGMINSNNIIDLIRIKAIDESLPEDRLQRLLRQKRFTEAQEFATKFSLNTEYIYQAEISILLQKLFLVNDYRNNEENQANLNMFIAALEKISDIKYIYCCIKNATMFIGYWSIKKLYEYVQKRIIEHINKSDQQEIQELSLLLRNVNYILERIETFESIQLTTNDCNYISEWSEFMKANFLDECIRYLSVGNVQAATIIWTRHTSSIIPQMTENEIKKLLNIILHSCTLDDLWLWFQYFIPAVVSFLPNEIDKIIQWAYEKTKSLEQSHRNQWPEIGLKFIKEFIDLLCLKDYNGVCQVNQQYININSKFHRLMVLMETASDLLELKQKHEINLSLSNYQSEPIDVVTVILNKAHISGIPKLMKNFLQRYMINHLLENDEALSKYIKNTLSRSKNWWIGDLAPWDEKLTAIISYINNIQIRLQQILNILKRAPVPWSKNLIELAKQSYKYNSPLVNEIRYESNFVAVKIILKKYGFAHIGLCPKLYNNIIKQNYSSMIDDLLELTKSKNDLRLNVFINCINYYLNQGDIEQVINILERLSDSLVLSCCKQIINLMKLKLNSLKDKDESLKHYFIVLGTIERKMRKILINNEENDGKFSDILLTIPLLQKLYNLHKEFNIFITFEGYYMSKKNILMDIIGKFSTKIDQDTDWLNLCKKIERLNDLLDLPKFYGVYQFLKMIKKSIALKDYLFSRFHECCIIFPDEYNYLNKICHLLVIIADDDPQLASFLENIYPSILINSPINELENNLSIANRINAYSVAVGLEMVQDNQTIKSLKIYSIYTNVLSLAGSNSLLSFNKNAFELISYYQKIRDGNEVNEELNKMILLMNKNLTDSAVKLKNDHHHYSLFKILWIIYTELVHVQADNEQLAQIQTLIKDCAFKLSKDVIKSRSADIHLGISCLLILSKKTALEIIKPTIAHIEFDPSREIILCDIGYEYCKLIKNNLIDFFHNRKLLHDWAQQLIPYEISFKEVIQSDAKGKKCILERIMKSTNSDVIELLEKFCHDFFFNYHECLLDYLKTLLCSWEPKYHLETAQDGQEKFKVDNTDVKKLKNLCKKIINKIQSNKDTNINSDFFLNHIIPLINFYHYEIFLILLELSEDKKINTLSYLYFLQSYTRFAKPTDVEKEAWEHFSQHDYPLPEIAKWRLPFLPKVNRYKLLTPELNLKTYEKWLTISRVLEIPTHNICSLAVKGTISETWLNPEYMNQCNINSNMWSVQSVSSCLLQDIKKCIQHLKTPEDIEFKTAIWYHVVTHAPPGADQAEAAKECYISAQQWQELDQTITPTYDKLIKIRAKYDKYTSKHILYSHELGQERYLMLVEDPQKLIKELYNDETIPQRYKGIIKHRPDINSAATELEKVFKINLKKLRLDLLNEWLQPKNWDSNKSEDNTMNIYRDLNTTLSDALTIDDELLKACYVVESSDKQCYINHLLIISFDEDKNAQMRFRALQIVQSHMDRTESFNYIKRDKNSFQNYMKSLQYLAELEKYGVHYSISGFENYPKQKFVEVLVNSQCSTRSLGLIPRLYADFHLNDYNLLNTALERLVKYSLINELKPNLLILGTMDCIVNCPGYVTACQLVIEHTFNKLDVHPSDEAINNCIEMLRLLHTCRITNQLQLDSIIEHCIQVKQSHFALVLLSYSNNIRKSNIIQDIKQSLDYNKVTEKLLELKKKGVLTNYESILNGEL